MTSTSRDPTHTFSESAPFLPADTPAAASPAPNSAAAAGFSSDAQVEALWWLLAAPIDDNRMNTSASRNRADSATASNSTSSVEA